MKTYKKYQMHFFAFYSSLYVHHQYIFMYIYI